MKVLKFVRDPQSAGNRTRQTSKSKSPAQRLSTSATKRSHLVSTSKKGSVITPSKPIRLSTVIDAQALHDMVLREAHQTSTDPQMTLIHILNTLDNLLERVEPKPSAEVAQQVYHDLLQQENRRTFDSIKVIQTQIEHLQAQSDSSGSTSPEKSFNSELYEQQVASQSLNAFQTASFADSNNKSRDRLLNRKENLKLKPEIILVQELQLKKNRSRAHHSSANTKSVSNHSSKRADSYDSKVPTSNKIQPFLFQNFSSGVGAHQGHTTPNSRTGTHLVTFSPSITDINESIKNHSKHQSHAEHFHSKIAADIPLSGAQMAQEVYSLQRSESFIKRCQKFELMYQNKKRPVKPDGNRSGSVNRNKDLTCVKPKMKLPKFKLVSSPQNSSSSEEVFFSTDQSQKVIDGSKALAIAYRVRKLLVKVLRSCQASVFERKARTYVFNICKKTYATSLVKKAYFSLLVNWEKHRGHKQAKIQADQLAKFRKRASHFIKWRHLLHEVLRERHQTFAVSRRRQDSIRFKVFQAWQQVIVCTRLDKMQNKTAKYLHRKNCLIKGYHGLRSYSNFSIRQRLSDLRSTRHYQMQTKRRCYNRLLEFQMEQRIVNTKLRIMATSHCGQLKRQAFVALSLHRCHAQHLRKMVILARASNQTSLQRRCLLKLQQYASMRVEKAQKVQFVSQLYESKIKRKLIRGLHETNLEFIRTQVHLEEYYARRRMRLFFDQMRAMVEVRRKVAQLSPFQVSLLLMWGGSTLLLMGDKKHSKEKLTKKASKLVLGSVWKAWRQRTNEIKNFKQKVQQRQLLKVVDFWSAYSHTRARLNRKLSGNLVAKHKSTKADVFTALRVVMTQAKKERRIQKIIASNHTKYQVKRAFGCWFSQYYQIDCKLQQKQISNAMGKHIQIKKFFSIWQVNQKIQMRKSHLAKLKQDFLLEKKSKIMHKWISQVNSNYLQNEISSKAAKQIQINKKRRIWRVMQRLVQINRTRDAKLLMWQQTQSKALKHKVFNAWATDYVPQQLTKQTLFQILASERVSKTLKSCFQALQHYLRFKRAQRVQTTLIQTQIQQIPLRKYLNRWQKLVQARFALRNLSLIVPRLQVSNALKSLHFNKCVGEATQEHIEAKHQQRLLQRALLALKRYQCRHTIKETQFALMSQVSQFCMVKQHLRAWRELCIQKTLQAHMIDRTFLAYAHWLKAKCFQQIKRKWTQKNKVNLMVQRSQQTLVRRSFRWLAKYAVTEMTSRYYEKQSRLQRKAKVFGRWLSEIRERITVQDFTKARNIGMRAKVLMALKEFVPYNQQISAKLETGLRNHNFFMAKNCLDKLVKFNKDQKNHRKLLSKIVYKSELNQMDKVFQILVQRTALHQNLQKCKQAVEHLVTKRLFSYCLNNWRPQCHSKIQQYRSMTNLCKMNQKLMQLSSLQIWKDFLIYSTKLNAEASKFMKQKGTLKLGPVLTVLKNYAKTKLVGKARIESINKYVVRRTLLMTFKNLRVATQQKQVCRGLKVRGAMFRHLGLQSKAFYMLQVNRSCQINRRFFIQKATVQRLLPKAFTALQLNMHMRKVSRFLHQKSQAYQQLNLKQKAFGTLRKKMLRGRDRTNFHNQVDQVYFRKLLQKTIVEWRLTTQKQRQLNLKRQVLFNAIVKVDGQNIQKFSFNALRVGVLQSQQRWLKAIIQKDQFTIGKLFASWRFISDYKRRAKQTAYIVHRKRQAHIRQVIFDRWLTVLSHQQKVQIQINRRGLLLESKVFLALKVMIERKLQVQYSLLHSDARILRKAWKSIKLHRADIEHRHMVAAQYELSQYEQYMTRCLLALKFNVVIEKGLRCLQQKQATQRKYAAWNALRYHSILSRVGKNFSGFRERKTRAILFQTWLKRASQVSKAKEALKPILQARFDQQRWLAFREWKRTAFMERVCGLIHYYCEDVNQEHRMKHIILAWRKYTYLRRNRGQLQSYLEQKRNAKTKQACLSNWYATLMHNLPTRLLFEKTAETFKRHMMRSALVNIASVAIKRTQMLDQAKAMDEHRVAKAAGRCFKQWRKAHLLEQALEVFEKRSRRKCFQKTILVWYNQMVQSQKQRKVNDRQDIQTEEADLFWAASSNHRVFLALKKNREHKQLCTQASDLYGAILLRKVVSAWRNQTQQTYRPADSEDSFQQVTEVAVINDHRQLVNEVYCHDEQDQHQEMLETQLCREVEQVMNRFRARRVLKGWQGYTRYRQQSRMIKDQLNEEALELRAHSLMTKAFRAWRVTLSDLHQEREEQDVRSTDRSRLYSLFSSWKLYVKERVLLKRYLVECGESPTNVSLMSTGHMRDNATRGQVSFRSAFNFN